jgi:hypothetical protein
MSNYSLIPGTFNCHTCKEEVKVLRLYNDTTDITWMCSQKHITKVTLKQRKYDERKR